MAVTHKRKLLKKQLYYLQAKPESKADNEEKHMKFFKYTEFILLNVR